MPRARAYSSAQLDAISYYTSFIRLPAAPVRDGLRIYRGMSVED